MTRWRRLVRDYEKRVDVSEAISHLAVVSTLLRGSLLEQTTDV